MEFRWLTDNEVLDKVNPICRLRGWAQLNINPEQPTCRVLGAFDENLLLGWITLQLFPVIGPEWVEPEARGHDLHRQLADRLKDYLLDAQARGALVICESPVTEHLAQRNHMTKLDFPVYVWVGGN